MIVTVLLPPQLARLGGLPRKNTVEVGDVVTLRHVLDAVETAAPALRGTIRAHNSATRRPFVRFYIGADDYSHADIDAPLPPAVGEGLEPIRIVGAIAGG